MPTTICSFIPTCSSYNVTDIPFEFGQKLMPASNNGIGLKWCYVTAKARPRKQLCLKFSLSTQPPCFKESQAISHMWVSCNQPQLGLQATPASEIISQKCEGMQFPQCQLPTFQCSRHHGARQTTHVVCLLNNMRDKERLPFFLITKF